MTVRQQVIEDRIYRGANLLSVTKNVAFLRFSHALVAGQSLHDFDDTEIVAGVRTSGCLCSAGQDHQHLFLQL